MYNCKVVSLVYYEHAPKEYVLPHNHNYFELVYYKKGIGEINIKSEKFNYIPNSVLIVKPGDLHDELSNDFSVVYIVLFEVDKSLGLNNLFVNLDNQSKEVLEDLFLKAFDEYQNQNSFYNEYVNNLFSLILIEVIRQTTKKDSSKTSNIYIKHTKKYIRENYVKDIDFKMLARTSGYSYDRFRHIFTNVTGVSPNQYLLNIRLAMAKKMLTETDELIKEIALKCGFSDVARFVNFFSDRMGVSPLKFRKMINQENEIGVVNISEGN